MIPVNELTADVKFVCISGNWTEVSDCSLVYEERFGSISFMGKFGHAKRRCVASTSDITAVLHAPTGLGDNPVQDDNKEFHPRRLFCSLESSKITYVQLRNGWTEIVEGSFEATYDEHATFRTSAGGIIATSTRYIYAVSAGPYWSGDKKDEAPEDNLPDQAMEPLFDDKDQELR